MSAVKIIFSVILGLVIFFGVLAYLSSDALRSQFLSADFYTESLAENDAYLRFYDAVLIPRTQDQLDEEGRAYFVGGLRIDKEDVGALVKGILTPPELRRQVEAAIQGAVDYLNKEDDPATGEPVQVPQVYIEFRPIFGTRTPTPEGVTPVTGTAKPVLTRFLVKQLKNNIEVLPPVEGTLPEKIEALSRQLYDTLDQLQDPRFPIQVPSLAGIPAEARAMVYDGARAILIAGGLSAQSIQGLDEADDKIKEELLQFDPEDALVDALAAALVPLVEPIIDQGIDEFRDRQLDSQDRFDPIARIAENQNQSKSEVLRDLDTVRDWLERGKTYGSWGALLVIVVASIAMGLLHLPSLRSFIGWPGLTLLLSGGIFLAIAIALRTQLPNRLESFLEVGESGCDALAGDVTGISTALCEIGVDVTQSMATDLAASLLVPSIVVLAVGGALVLASFGLKRRSPAS